MNTNTNSGFVNVTRGRHRDQVQQTKPVLGFRPNVMNSNASYEKTFEIMGDLDRVDASCYFRSIYQSARNRGLLYEIADKLWGVDVTTFPKSEDQFVQFLRDAMAFSIETGQELQPGGSLSSLPELLELQGSERNPKNDFLDMFSGFSGSLDFRLLKALDDAAVQSPDGRLVFFLTTYTALLRQTNFWPSAFEFNWIKKRLRVSTEDSASVKMTHMRAINDQVVGPRRNGFLKTNSNTGMVAVHIKQKATDVLKMLWDERQGQNYDHRTILLVQYGFAAVQPFPGNQYLGRDRISHLYPGFFVEALYTFFREPEQAQSQAQADFDNMQSGGRVRVRARMKKPSSPKAKPKTKASPKNKPKTKASPKKPLKKKTTPKS